MAENEENNEEQFEEEPQKSVITHVTQKQWLSIFCLLGMIIYLYVLWPVMATKEKHLKDPEVYLTGAREKFREAHLSHAFPKNTRIRTFMDVVWNYEAARRASANFEIDDYYRWGVAGYKVARFKYKSSRYALVEPIRNFTSALEKIESIYKRYLDEFGPIEADLKIKEHSHVDKNKISYYLGLSYLTIGGFDKAIPYLQDLRDKKIQYENYQRKLDRNGSLVQMIPPVELGASPYVLQLRELQRSDLLLGKAYQQTNDILKASNALNGYLEATKKSMLSRRAKRDEIELDIEARYEALSLLGKIHWKASRNLFQKMKQKMAMRKQATTEMQALQQKWKQHLRQASIKLKELFAPEYKVYGLKEQKLMLAEVYFRLGENDQTLNLAKGYIHEDRYKAKEMELWKILALLDKNKDEPVASFLAAIAGSNIKRHVQLAALVILGDHLVSLGKTDRTLGSLIQKSFDGNQRDVGAYLRAAEDFDEREFDKNPFINKLNLIDAVALRARKARDNSQEQMAIRLYQFLLKHFTVPQAQMIHQVAFLQRQMARESLVKEGMTKMTRKLFKKSAETFLMANNVPYDGKAKEETHYQAGESFFEGRYYSRAYETYGEFLQVRPDDKRRSKVRHKRGVAALYRKKESRFNDAKEEFMKNINKNVRPVWNNKALGEDIRPGLERIELDKILSDVDTSARDIWAYQSLLELGNLYYSSHEYENAKKIYERIQIDPRFTPRSEVRRKATYQLAKLTYDMVFESPKKVKPWQEAIGKLEDVLFLYDLTEFRKRFSVNDRVLLEDLKKQNTAIKILLAKAYLKNNSPDHTIIHARELLANKKDFSLMPKQEQRVEAILADGLYQNGKYEDAMEHYRRAHDRYLDAYERPFYSLNIVDCLEKMGHKEKAIEHLKRTRWEFERVFKEDDSVLQKENRISRQEWLDLVDDRIRSLQG